MRLLWRYVRFIYRRFWDVDKSGSLGEFRLQILPWMGVTFALLAVSSLFGFAPNSYPQIALALIVMSPNFVGIVVIWRVWWRVSNRRMMLEPVLDVSNG